MRFIAVAILAGLPMSAVVAEDAKPHDAELKQVAAFMAGSFSSKEQSEKDTTYFDVRLQMSPMWTQLTGRVLDLCRAGDGDRAR